jgi:hypothetical protein
MILLWIWVFYFASALLACKIDWYLTCCHAFVWFEPVELIHQTWNWMVFLSISTYVHGGWLYSQKKNASGHVSSYWMLKWFVVHMLRECLIFIIINKLGLLRSSPFPCCGCNTISIFEIFIDVFLPTK